MQKKPQHRRSLFLNRVPLFALLVFGVMATFIGCDAAVVLSFGSTNLSKVKNVAFCAQPGSSSNKFDARYILLDDKGEGVRKGDVIGGGDFEVESVALKSESYTDYGTIACSDTSNCTSPLTCENIKLDSSLKACQLPNQYRLNFEKSDHRNDKEAKTRLFAVLFEESYSVTGLSPSNGVFQSDDGDYTQKEGIGEGSDKNSGLKKIFVTLQSRFGQVQKKRKNEGYKDYFAFGVFGSNLKVYQNNRRKYYSDNPTDFSSNLNIIGNSEKVSVFTSIQNWLDSSEYTDGLTNPEVTLVVFVDGYDEARNIGLLSGLIKKAKDKNTRIFIVHVDPDYRNRINSGSGTKHQKAMSVCPVFKEYYKGQSGACSDDSDCLAYEKCVIPDKDPSENSRSTTKYCIPKVSLESCQTGPIDSYAELACATGGAYYYYPKYFYEINNEIIDLPWLIDSYWVTSASSTNQWPHGRYQVFGDFEVKAEGEQSAKVPFRVKKDQGPMLIVPK